MTNTSINDQNGKSFVGMAEVEKVMRSYEIDEVSVDLQIKSIVSKVLRLFVDKYNKNTENVVKNCNDFEIFGVDFLINSGGRVFLLEINANPDFKATDDEKFEIYKKPFDSIFRFLDEKMRFIQQKILENPFDITKNDFMASNSLMAKFSCEFNHREAEFF